jgi:hypothetical protein
MPVGFIVVINMTLVKVCIVFLYGENRRKARFTKVNSVGTCQLANNAKISWVVLSVRRIEARVSR